MSQTTPGQRRVVFLLPNLEGGGTQKAHLLLANAAADLGFEVDLVVGQARGAFVKLVSSKVRLVDLRGLSPYSPLWSRARYLKRKKPEALFSALNGATALAVAAVSLARVSTKVIPSVQNHLGAKAERRGWLYRLAIRSLLPLVFRRAHRVVAVSESIRTYMEQSWKLRPERIAVVHNPVDIAALRRAAAEEAPSEWHSEWQTMPVIIGAGRLHEQKDFATLIKAFALLRQRREARLIILGEGSEREKLETLATDHGVAEWVQLPGFVSNPHAWMARADCFALSSQWEGSPLVALEALALGMRVVSTDCESGPRELMNLGAPMALVPVGDVEALALALDRSLEHPPKPASATLLATRDSVACARAYLDLIDAR